MELLEQPQKGKAVDCKFVFVLPLFTPTKLEAYVYMYAFLNYNRFRNNKHKNPGLTPYPFDNENLLFWSA